MKKIQFEGSSLEEALIKASEELSLDESQISYEIIDESKGFLGIGTKKVVIEVSIEEEPVEVSIVREEDEPVEEAVLDLEESKEDVFFDTAKDFLESTINKMGISANLIVDTVNEELISFEIIGEDIAILIGKYGATLDSLQYLACIIANKKCPCKRRIVIDADGHRAKRTKELQDKALKIADMVVKHGKEAVMEPQSAKDRRIVHMILRNHSGVKTYSEGDGMDRHVIISPKEN